MPENTCTGTISSQAAQEWVEGSTHRARSPERTVKPHERAVVRRCVKCKVEKHLKEFDKSRKSLRRKCKRCRLDESKERYASSEESRKRKLRSSKAWRMRDPERARFSDAKSYSIRRDKILAQKKAYHRDKYESLIRPYKKEYLADPAVQKRRQEYNKSYHKEYYRNNKARYLAKFIERRERKRQALPSWADKKAIQAFYQVARDKTKQTGVRHEVDHIVPLKGEFVCGLHVETNLQIISRKANRRKHNRLIEDVC